MVVERQGPSTRRIRAIRFTEGHRQISVEFPRSKRVDLGGLIYWADWDLSEANFKVDLEVPRDMV